MNNIYVLYAHPDPSASKVNVAKRQALFGLDRVVVNDLYQSYPKGRIDAERERANCDAADIIVFQFPLYWYSAPPLLRQWQDDVLTHGWAYGSRARGLKGKDFQLAVTVGAPEQGYREGGKHGATLDVLLSPFTQTARFCSLRPLPIQADFATFAMSEGDVARAAALYRDAIIALRDGIPAADALA